MLETALKVLVKGVYTTLKFQEEQLLQKGRRTREEEVLLAGTRESISEFEMLLGLSSDSKPVPQISPESIVPGGIVERIRSGDIPINTSNDSDTESLIIGASGTIEITEDDEVIDIINTSQSSNVIPISKK